MGLCQCACLAEKSGRLSLADGADRDGRGGSEGSGLGDAKLCRFRQFEPALTGPADGRSGSNVRGNSSTSNGQSPEQHPQPHSLGTADEASRRLQKRAMLYGLRSMRPVDEETAETG